MHKDDSLSNLPSVENTDSSAVPQNSATGNFASDAGQQGIFSSSDTRIETENLPEVPEVVQQVPMSSITPVLRTESTVTGDLKLGGTSKKKKWPLVVLGVAAVALVGVGVWALINNSNPPTPQDRTTYSITDESRNLFNHYINFLIEGNDSTDKPDLLNFLANNYTYLSPGAMYAEKIKLVQ